MCSFAQELLLTLEAESAELTLPSKIKSVNGYSENKYVGDNDPGSAIVFRNVNVQEEGTYEFRTFYTSMHIRSVAIQSGFYPAVVSTTPITTPDWNMPPVESMTTYIYLDKGNNIVKITPHDGGAPNIDKFEIWTTPVSMSRPEIQKAASDYDLADDAIITVNGNNETLSSLNDNDEFTVFTYSGSTAEVYIECDMPYLITGYLLSAGAGSTENVSNWKLEYSVNGINYQTLSSSGNTDLNTAVLFHVNREPHADAAKATKYYKLTAQGGKIGEIQLFGIPYLIGANGKNFPTDITDGQDIYSKVIGNPLGTFSGDFDERCYNLFDRNMSRKYYRAGMKAFDVEVELNEPYSLDYYTLTSCQDYPERDPKAWVVEGFDTDWEIVSEVNNFTFPCRYATMKFNVGNSKKYKGYRLRTTENNGADAFQLLKWQLFGKNATTALTTTGNEQVDIYSLPGKIIIAGTGEGDYFITDLYGRQVAAGRLQASTVSLQLHRGVYVVTITMGHDRVIKKVLVN